MKTTPHFGRLYAISDLHLGGRAGFQIFDSGELLGRFVSHICRDQPQTETTLVINGDMVDFLAEPGASYFDPEGAAEKLNRIVDDPSFAPAWRGLRQFVAAPKRNLVINLGNHDLELALPWVRETLLDILTEGKPVRRSKVTLVFDGVGFSCRVGDAKVLCIHGNEVDPWNVTDFEQLRRIGRDFTQGRPVKPWIPNAGTQLVIEVMNDLKRRFPFIDLLKPEAEAVVPTLLALDPAAFAKVTAIAAPVVRLSWDGIRMRTGFLFGDETETEGVKPDNGRFKPMMQSPLHPTAGSSFTIMAEANYAEMLLREAEEKLRQNIAPSRLIHNDQHEQYLGWFKAGWKWASGSNTTEVLRAALDKLEKDRSFDLKTEDYFSRSLDESMGSEIDFLLAGHTHLERALPRQRGAGCYFNTGTWVRRIQLTRSMLDNAEAFARVYDTFAAGTLAELDREPGLVLRRPAAAVIWTEGSVVHGELCQVVGAGASVQLTPFPQSRFTRG